jgi:hypothetical protein
MHDKGLYDCDGRLVGMWNGERGMLSDCFVVSERTCHITDSLWTSYGRNTWGCICSNCKAHMEHEVKRRLRFCPQCGAKVVD